jgi:hypothetical protein
LATKVATTGSYHHKYFKRTSFFIKTFETKRCFTQN